MTQRERHLSEGFFELKQRPGEGFCCVRGCRKDAVPGKLGLCHCHYQHRWRMKSPKQSAFAAVRDHAKERGIEFKLDFSYFEGLLDAYAYFDHAAESRGEYPSLDRIKSTVGYVRGNVRVITHGQNVVRNNRERHLPEYVQSLLARKRARAKENPALAGEQVRDEDERNPF